MNKFTGHDEFQHLNIIPEGNILVYSEGSKQNAQRVLGQGGGACYHLRLGLPEPLFKFRSSL
jgi:hypothetical protein